MHTNTQIFLAYIEYKRTEKRRKPLSFSEYVTETPDLASLILVAKFREENGIQPASRRGRPRKG